MARHILIIGAPGSGKTTLIMKLAMELKDLDPIGFYTEEIREDGERKGFRLVGLDHGGEALLSHTAIKSPATVGRYHVDVKGFEEFLKSLDVFAPSHRLIILDEIGKMECLSEKFRDLVRKALDSGTPVIATVAIKGEGLITEVKERGDVEIRVVTPASVGELFKEIADEVRERE